MNLRLFIAGLSAALLSHCVQSFESDISLTPSAKADKEYQVAFDKATKDRKVFANFETKYLVTATYLSPDFKTAFSKRLEKVYKQDIGRFDEAGGKAGFFVSIHAPESERIDLANPRHWTILLENKDGSAKPVLVKKINDKERWRAFFPSVSDWTSEYLIVFDTPAIETNSAQVVEKMNISLTLANADAQVKLDW